MIAIATTLGLAGCSTSTAHADTATSASHLQTHQATSTPSAITTPAAPVPTSATPSASAAATAAVGTAAQTAPSSATLRQELLSAPVPALCKHAAGRLVNGALPGPLSAGYVRSAWLVGGGARSENALSATGAFQGAGSSNVAAAIACSAGGAPWPEVVGVWTQDGSALRLVGVFPPEQLSHNIVSMSSVQALGSTVHIAWSGPAPGKDDADGSEHSSAVLTVDGGRIIASGYHSTIG
ncbi:hypothetical protein [Curtobacterium sp. MCBD17_040]|uniref:hypothetical protein n=1 Tax=Curtobacterium sp. MCBD17_040 TaxID=2175674 RepID=UPI000DA7F1B6|nr:hypothetical protein [Curtobacterium sp. MCBD17_040]WIB63583.1 hypothetical protein DEI94_15765 [Curtobacterium sp. MCBD17_040]